MKYHKTTIIDLIRKDGRLYGGQTPRSRVVVGFHFDRAFMDDIIDAEIMAAPGQAWWTSENLAMTSTSGS